MAERIVSEVLIKPDAALEMTLRPSLFSEFTGQAISEDLRQLRHASPAGTGLEAALRVSPDGPTVAIPSGLTLTAIASGLAVTVVLGVFPQPVLALADRAALFIR